MMLDTWVETQFVRCSWFHICKEKTTVRSAV